MRPKRSLRKSNLYLKVNNINFIETGITHGTITVVINKLKFEITTLRKDVSTDDGSCLLYTSPSPRDRG